MYFLFDNDANNSLNNFKPSDKKKSRKQRGHVSSGHGRVGKHRKHPGGRGNAGGQHHHRILFEKYHPEHFGKKGMRYFHRIKQHKYNPTINIEKILNLVKKKGITQNKTIDKIPIINISHFGFFTLLGKGKKPEFPLIIKAKKFSKNAEKKILKSGGKCILIP